MPGRFQSWDQVVEWLATFGIFDLRWEHSLGVIGLALSAWFMRWWAGPPAVRGVTRPWLAQSGQAHPPYRRNGPDDASGTPYDE